MLAYFDDVAAKFSQDIEIEGFRKGMAPKAMILEKVGQTRVANAALEQAVNDTFPQALKEHSLAPATAPKINIKTYPSFLEGGQNELIYEAEIAVLPQAKVKDWQKIKVFQPSPNDLKVTPKDVDQTLEFLKKQMATLQIIDQPIQNNNQVEIDFEGYENGVKGEKLSSKNHPLAIGSGRMVSGFEENLVGLKKDQTKEFDLVFPKDYPVEEMRGKKVHFKVKINIVREVILPKDETLLEKLGHKDMPSLRKALEGFVKDDKGRRLRSRQEFELSQELVKITKAEIPPKILEHETNRLKEQILADLRERQIEFNEYLTSLKTTEDEFDKALLKQAEHNILVTLALQAIGRETDIDVTVKDGLKKVVEYLLNSNQK